MGTPVTADCQLVRAASTCRKWVSNYSTLTSLASISSFHRFDTLCRFNQLQAVDVEGVPPAVRIDMEGDNVLRPDTPVQYEAR